MRSTNATLSILSTLELAFELSNDKGSSGKVHLRASEIDSLIAKLAQHRSDDGPGGSAVTAGTRGCRHDP